MKHGSNCTHSRHYLLHQDHHRPWACHRLVQSLRKEFGEPKIVVVDDGLPEHWFSRKYPETAKHCKVIDLQQHDVGVGVGRNTAIDAAETEFIFLLDDDQIVTPDLHLDRVYQRFIEYELDVLAVRQGDGGRPMLFSPLMNGTRIWMHRGERKTYWRNLLVRHGQQRIPSAA